MLGFVRAKWFWPLVAGLIVVGVFGWQFAFGADHDAVVRQLEERYDVGQVEWVPKARYEPEKLVVDGRDISEACTVVGASGSPDDARIECQEDLGIGDVVE